MQAEVTFARNRHTERAVCEHFDAYRLALRPQDGLFLNLLVNERHAVQVDFARQNRHIGITGIKGERLRIGDIELCREMNRHALLSRIEQNSRIRGDNGINARRFGTIHHRAHRDKVVIKQNGVQREVAFHSGVAACFRDAGYVLPIEVGGRVRAHVQFARTKVHTIRTGTDSGLQRFVRSGGSHHLKIRLPEVLSFLHLISFCCSKGTQLPPFATRAAPQNLYTFHPKRIYLLGETYIPFS